MFIMSFYRIGSEDVGQPRKNESVHRQENASKHTDGKGLLLKDQFISFWFAVMECFIHIYIAPPLSQH